MKNGQRVVGTQCGIAEREIKSSHCAMRSCGKEPIVRLGPKKGAVLTKPNGAGRTFENCAWKKSGKVQKRRCDVQCISLSACATGDNVICVAQGGGRASQLNGRVDFFCEQRSYKNRRVLV